jgi:hypothetical protein
MGMTKISQLPNSDRMLSNMLSEMDIVGNFNKLFEAVFGLIDRANNLMNKLEDQQTPKKIKNKDRPETYQCVHCATLMNVNREIFSCPNCGWIYYWDKQDPVHALLWCDKKGKVRLWERNEAKKLTP